MPPWPCTIGFGSPVVPEREQHVERVVERHALDHWSSLALVRDLAVPITCTSVGSPARIAASSSPRSMRLAAVRVAVDRDQHLRLDLGEAVDHAARPELGRHAGPDRAEARGGQKPDERLGDVGQVGDDPIALRDAQLAQPRLRVARQLVQLAVRQLERLARLRARDDRDLVAVAEDVRA